jgi:hypothetical protein
MPFKSNAFTPRNNFKINLNYLNKVGIVVYIILWIRIGSGGIIVVVEALVAIFVLISLFKLSCVVFRMHTDVI